MPQGDTILNIRNCQLKKLQNLPTSYCALRLWILSGTHPSPKSIAKIHLNYILFCIGYYQMKTFAFVHTCVLVFLASLILNLWKPLCILIRNGFIVSFAASVVFGYPNNLQPNIWNKTREDQQMKTSSKFLEMLLSCF